jgi:hypothetical protein
MLPVKPGEHVTSLLAVPKAHSKPKSKLLFCYGDSRTRRPSRGATSTQKDCTRTGSRGHRVSGHGHHRSTGRDTDGDTGRSTGRPHTPPSTPSKLHTGPSQTVPICPHTVRPGGSHDGSAPGSQERSDLYTVPFLGTKERTETAGGPAAAGAQKSRHTGSKGQQGTAGDSKGQNYGGLGPRPLKCTTLFAQFSLFFALIVSSPCKKFIFQLLALHLFSSV